MTSCGKYTSASTCFVNQNNKQKTYQLDVATSVRKLFQSGCPLILEHGFSKLWKTVLIQKTSLPLPPPLPPPHLTCKFISLLFSWLSKPFPLLLFGSHVLLALSLPGSHHQFSSHSTLSPFNPKSENLPSNQTISAI